MSTPENTNKHGQPAEGPVIEVSEELFRQYEGPVNEAEFFYELDKGAALDALGIDSVELPGDVASALGRQRAERLKGLVEGEVKEIHDVRPEPRKLLVLAQGHDPALRAFNRALSRRVWEMEASRDALAEELKRLEVRRNESKDALEAAQERSQEANDQQRDLKSNAEVTVLVQERFDTCTMWLDQVAEDPEHPEAWLATHGPPYAKALAVDLTREARARELEPAREPKAAQQLEAGPEIGA